MPEAKIYQVIRKQREAIERSEVSTLRYLARQWVAPYHFLKKQVDALVKLIQARQAAGKPVQVEHLHSLDRYQSMMEQARRTIDKYNRAALGRISGAEADAVEIGKSNAQELIHIAEPDDPMWTRVNKREARIMSAMLSEPSPLRVLLDQSWPDAKEKIDEVLMVGLSTGQGSQWIADRLEEAVTIPEKRALTIARTEVNRTYRAANLETMRESRAMTGYRRMCYPPTACFACLMMDGEYYPKMEDFSDHPNGKCSAVPVTKHFDPINDPNWERGQDWFAKQDPETQRKIMGKGRYELWKNEGVDPRSMVYIKPNPVWGGSPAVKTLEELKNDISPSEYRGLFENIFSKPPKLDSILPIDKVGQEFPEWEKDDTLSLEQSIKGTNINAQDETIPSWMYKENCQKCVPTWELRRRGFMVESLPLSSEDDFYTQSDNWQLIYQDGKKHTIDNLQGSGESDIIELMKQWGTGSRAEIAVKWGDGSGHIFSAENIDGKILFIDPQWGTYGKEVKKYFGAVVPGSTKVLRIDNLRFTEKIHDCATGATR